MSNNLSDLLAVETLAGIKAASGSVHPGMLTEIFRISNHRVAFATFAHDMGAITPDFYTFREREMVMDIVELITGARLHPSWFRLGGVAADLPEGWRN